MKKLLFLIFLLASGSVLYSQTLPTPYGNTQLKMANGDTTWIGTLSQLTGFFGSGGTVTEINTGAGLTGGPINTTGTIQVATNGIVDNLFRQSAGLSVVGRSANTTGNIADITAASDKQVLRRDGTSIGFGAIDIASSNAVTGTLGVANGGTGQTTFTDGQLLIGNTTGNTLTKATLTAGTGISITNGSGAITIAANYGSIPLTNGQIFIGNASNVATAAAVTGDITISNTGVTAIAAGVIVNADIASNAAITRSKLVNGSADHVLINSATGEMSSEAQLQPSRGGTGESTLIAARRVLDGFNTTATAGGTTTLNAVSSTYNQVFTGTQTQTITLPATSALGTGGGYLIVNNSTGTLTVQTSVPATLGTIPSGASARVMVLNTSTNNVADWEFAYAEFATITGTGSTMVLQSSPRIVNPTLAGVTYSTATTHIAGTSNQGSGAMPDSVVINVTSVGANNPGGVTLPATSTGKKVVVINSTIASQGVNVFPASGSTIDLLGSNQPINIPSRGIIEFVAISSTQWISSVKQVTDLSFTTGTLPISKGGTGLTSIGAGNANAILSSNSAGDGLSYRKIGIENDISQNPRYRIETDSFVLNLPDATASVRGLVSTLAQTFAGNKTFNGFIDAAGGLTATNFSTSSALNINGSVKNKVSTLTASTTLDLSHNTINVNNSSQITLTLPTCNGVVLGLTYTIYKISSNTQATVISTASGDTFVGGSTSKFLINQGTDATCTCNGANLWTYSSL